MLSTFFSISSFGTFLVLTCALFLPGFCCAPLRRICLHFLHFRLPKTSIKSPLALFSPPKANPALPASQVVCSSPQAILVTPCRPPAGLPSLLCWGSWRGTQSRTHRSRGSLTAAEQRETATPDPLATFALTQPRHGYFSQLRGDALLALIEPPNTFLLEHIQARAPSRRFAQQS